MNKGDYCFLQSRHKFHKRHRNDDFDDKLNNLFNKKFQFRFETEWELPVLDSWFSDPPWKVKKLEILKQSLNFHKSQLNDYDIEEWSAHTRRRNPAGDVCWKLRCLVNPEFLTQAWTKFYECACSYNIIPTQAVTESKMVSLHLCEAPGAFITSLNHFLKQNYGHIEWKWLANTLNPYYEGNSPSNMISDDRFMFHTLHNWDFGVDSTGNLMDWRNSQAIVKNAQALGKVLLVTADGSIDCVQTPDAQEEATSPLHYCEIVTALQALHKDGTLIFKLFTTFEHSTVNLLYLVNHVFEEVNIYKPVTSRQGNSEVYAICLHYKGIETIAPYLPKLKLAYGTSLYEGKSLFRLEDIPETFLKQIEECADYFRSLQCEVISNNLQAYQMQAHNVDIKKIRAVVAAEYIRLYDLRPIVYDQEILKGILHEENKVNVNPRYHRGSYTERSSYSTMTVKAKCKSLSTFLRGNILNLQIFINDSIWACLYDEEIAISMKYQYGLALDKVNSSKFIFVPMFKLYQQILAEKQFVDVILNHSKDDAAIDVNCDARLNLPKLDTLEPYSEHEKRCFVLILKTLKGMSLGETVLLCNFVPLTHFNASVLFILSKKCFEKVGFTAANSIILSNMMSKSGLRYLESVETECRQAADFDVLNFLPVNLTNVGEFYTSVMLYNNTVCRNRCVNYLSILERVLCNE